jgi:hypothetical protein
VSLALLQEHPDLLILRLLALPQCQSLHCVAGPAPSSAKCCTTAELTHPDAAVMLACFCRDARVTGTSVLLTGGAKDGHLRHTSWLAQGACERAHGLHCAALDRLEQGAGLVRGASLLPVVGTLVCQLYTWTAISDTHWLMPGLIASGCGLLVTLSVQASGACALCLHFLTHRTRLRRRCPGGAQGHCGPRAARAGLWLQLPGGPPHAGLGDADPVDQGL